MPSGEDKKLPCVPGNHWWAHVDTFCGPCCGRLLQLSLRTPSAALAADAVCGPRYGPLVAEGANVLFVPSWMTTLGFLLPVVAVADFEVRGIAFAFTFEGYNARSRNG